MLINIRSIATLITFFISSCNLLHAEDSFEFAFQASYENTPLGVALEFATNDEEYMIANADDFNHIAVNGSFYGDSINDLLDSIAASSGHSIQYNDKQAIIY